MGDRLSSDRDERARQRVELAVTSVLLDAGAGPDWRWRDPVTGREFARSEGLALASLEAFRTGVFSSDPNQPCRADAEGLAGVSLARLGHAFQVSETNELVGLTGRVQLLKHLGRPFTHIHAIGLSNRVGALFDIMKKDADLGRVRVTEPFWAGFPVQPSADYVGVVFASDILGHVLMWLRDIWPNRTTIDYFSFGDTWRHPAITVAGETRGLIPFHKLSQWLSYSLIEPLEEAGLTVAHQDQLTGLAEYRNGGLFIDMGVIVPRDAALLTTPLTPDREPIVEWRALTIALLDEIAPLVRTELGVTAAQMPLASVLEGGTWAAGRRIAKEKRADGGPPLVIVSDGTVF